MFYFGKSFANVDVGFSHDEGRLHQLSSVSARGGENHLGCCPVHMMIFVPEVAEDGTRSFTFLNIAFVLGDAILKGFSGFPKILSRTFLTWDGVSPHGGAVRTRGSVDQTTTKGVGLPKSEFRVEGQ